MDAFFGALTIVPNGRKMQKCCVKNANFSLPFGFCVVVVVVFVDLNERTNELRTRFSEYVYVFYIFLLASD